MRIGPYSLHGTIAAGGFGQVDYATADDGKGGTRLVAVKRMRADRSNDEALAMLADEARLVSRIRHPNVIGVLDVIRTESELFVVMEYVDGETLAFFLRRAQKLRDPIPLPIVSAIVVGALEGLHAAHEAVDENGAPLGIVHRDVSLPNIMVGTDGRARLLDFGVAKAEGRLQSTSIGELKGKLAYMAPEQLALQPVTPRSDLYAVGVVLWELIASRRLFDSPDGATTIEKVLKGPIVPPSRYASNVPLALEQLVLRSLSRDPAERFATGAEMAAELAACIPPAEPGEIGHWVEAAGTDTAARRRTVPAKLIAGDERRWRRCRTRAWRTRRSTRSSCGATGGCASRRWRRAPCCCWRRRWSSSSRCARADRLRRTRTAARRRWSSPTQPAWRPWRSSRRAARQARSCPSPRPAHWRRTAARPRRRKGGTAGCEVRAGERIREPRAQRPQALSAASVVASSAAATRGPTALGGSPTKMSMAASRRISVVMP